jgi:hypothetical protein
MHADGALFFCSENSVWLPRMCRRATSAASPDVLLQLLLVLLSAYRMGRRRACLKCCHVKERNAVRITATVPALWSLPDCDGCDEQNNFIEFTPIEGCEG